MAYTRFGSSDLYLFATGGSKLECCACPLRETMSSVYLRSLDEALAHFAAHKAKGHHVVQGWDALENEIRREAGWIWSGEDLPAGA